MTELPRWLKQATVWLLLALAIFVGVQAWTANRQATRFVVAGDGTLEIRRGADGHYRWPGRLGAEAVEFLVDTGATGTAIPAALARQLRLPVVGQLRSNTAGGVVDADVVLADLVLEGGVAVDRLRVAALPQLASPLLGMDVLGRLHFQQSQGVLRIRRQGPAD